MPNYEVYYSFERLDLSRIPDEERYGQGFRTVTTDVEVTEDKHVRELAKQLFRDVPDCKQLMINKILVLDENGEKIELDN